MKASYRLLFRWNLWVLNHDLGKAMGSLIAQSGLRKRRPWIFLVTQFQEMKFREMKLQETETDELQVHENFIKFISTAKPS
jgi:hypothetical protein